MFAGSLFAVVMCLAVLLATSATLNADDGEKDESDDDAPAVERDAAYVLLQKLADRHLKNSSRLVTWRGKVRVTDERGVGEVLAERRTSDVEFTVDRSRQANLWRWQPVEFVGVEQGIERAIAPLPLGSTRGIRTPAGFFRQGPIPVEEQNRPYPVEVEAAEYVSGESEMSDQYFDPFYFLSDCGESMVVRLGGIAEAVKNSTSWKVSQSGSRLVVETLPTLSATGTPLRGRNRYAFDRARGGLLQSFTMNCSEGDLTRNVSVERQGDAWVPNGVTILRTQHERNSWHRRVIRWTASQLNEPIAEREFTLQALGVPAGSRVLDKRTDTKYDLRYLPDGKSNAE